MHADQLNSLLDSFGLTRRKLYQYLSLFFLLAAVYSIYLYGIIHGPSEINLFGWALGKFCLISAVPFAALAFSDKNWRSSDAAPVALGAWIAVFVAFSLKSGSACPIGAAVLFLPLVLSALLAHTVGALAGLAT